jgi:hypothetical protein
MYEEHFHLSTPTRQDNEAAMLRTARHTLDVVQSAWLGVQARISEMFSPTVVVDEMSLFFPTESAIAQFAKYAVQLDGHAVFNTAVDRVHTTPVRNDYDVLYWFLTTPHGYRLELMAAGSGSPVHDERRALLHAASEESAMPSVAVHASFKCDDEGTYSDAVRVLRAHDYEMVQGCTSSYGRFSYWQPINGSLDAVSPTWYLKPRINLRDGSAAGLDQSEQATETRAAGE